jgi:Protein of unknown function (DUF2817)
MIGIMEAFSTSYATARVKFLEAAATASLQIESFNSPSPGKNGEVHALDVALQRPVNGKAAEKLLIINAASPAGDSVGGSAVQVFMLKDAEWMAKVQSSGTSDLSVLYLHGFDISLSEVVKKHVSAAKKATLVDISGQNNLKTAVFDALKAAQLEGKCRFLEVKSILKTEPAWQGQTISLARQALFKAVDALNKV